jgi:hypothetical protein
MSAAMYLKFLASGRRAPFTGTVWPAPKSADEWVETEGTVTLCVSGVHACRTEHLGYWLNEELWVVELEDVEPGDHSKVVARRGRLRERVAAWDAAALADFAHECARRARVHAAASIPSGLAPEADTLKRTEAPSTITRLAARLKRAGLEPALVNRVRYAGDAAALARELGSSGGGTTVEGSAARSAALAAHTAALVAARGSATAYDKERRAHGVWLAERLGLGRAITPRTSGR